MDKSTRKTVIRPVPNWATVAALFKEAGCRNTSEFILTMTLSCIRIPAHELIAVRRVFAGDDGRIE